MDRVVEEALIRAFIVPAKRRRYLDKLDSPKARHRFLNENIHHMADLDERYAQKLDPRRPRAESLVIQIYDRLRKLGAPSRCYVISTGDLDGREGELREVLETVVGAFQGTFISCIPGRLAYFEGELENDRYILERPA
jgi:hypothetical protein